MADCYFDRGKRCEALTVKKCEGCTFRKTEFEYNKGIERAHEILKSKGLKAYLSDGVVTVKEIKKNEF